MLQQKLTKAGDTMSGALDMGMNRTTGIANPKTSQDAATKTYEDFLLSLKVSKAGDTMSDSIYMNLNKITNLGDPVNAQNVVTKNYLDTLEGECKNCG